MPNHVGISCLVLSTTHCWVPTMKEAQHGHFIPSQCQCEPDVVSDRARYLHASVWCLLDSPRHEEPGFAVKKGPQLVSCSDCCLKSHG